MAFLALIILERGIGLLSVFFVIVRFLEKMNNNILDAVCRLGIEKVKGIIRGRKMAVHTVRHKTLGIIHMGRCLPSIICELNLVTGCTKLRRGGADHGVISDTEQRKGDDDAD